jgi:DNA-binding response OmpR family regulator
MTGTCILAGMTGEAVASVTTILSRHGLRAVSVEATIDADALARIVDLRLILFDVETPDSEALLDFRQIRASRSGAAIFGWTLTGATDGSAERLARLRATGAHSIVGPASLDMELTVFEERGFGTRAFQRRVLIIEDDSTVRKILSKYVEDAGYLPVARADWESAISDPETFGVDIVVTDIFMPGMGGIAGIVTVKRDWLDTPVIALSAGLGGRMGPETVLKACKTIGADITLQKPITKDTLLEAIASLVA